MLHFTQLAVIIIIIIFIFIPKNGDKRRVKCMKVGNYRGEYFLLLYWEPV